MAHGRSFCLRLSWYIVFGICMSIWNIIDFRRASNQFHMKKTRGALFEHDIRAAVSGRVVRKRSSFFILLLPSLFLENKMSGDQCISLLPLHIEGGEVAKSSLVW